MRMDCPVCLATITEGCVVTYCGHKYHMECIVEWKRVKPDSGCPICRHSPLVIIEDVDVNTLRKNYIDIRLANRELSKQLETLRKTYVSIYEDRATLQRQVALLSNRLDIINKMLVATTSLATE